MYWTLKEIAYNVRDKYFESITSIRTAVFKTIQLQYNFSEKEADYIEFYFFDMFSSYDGSAELEYLDKIENFCELYAKLKQITSSGE